LEHAGAILGALATRNAKAAESIELVRSEWRRMQEGGPTEDELAEAKTFLTGSFALQFDSTQSIAAILLSLQEHHLGIDYLERRNALIDGVTLDAVRRVAKKLLDPAALSFAVVGEPEGLRATREIGTAAE
jgi:zinc protease